MAVNPSIQLGTSGNWAIKEDNLLAYKQLGNKFFDREFDFSRGTTATFVGRNGLIQESAIDVPRIDFADDTTGHLLLEPQSTNRMTTSEPTSGGVGFTFPPKTWANGLINGFNATEATSSIKYWYMSSGIANEYSTFSFFVEMEDGSEPIIGGSTDASSDFVVMVKGWFMAESEITKTNTIANVWKIEAPSRVNELAGTGPIGILKYSGQSNKTFSATGFQIEQQSFATSYIPTSGSAVTRNQELCNNSGTVNDFNSEEGVIYAEIAALNSVTSQSSYITISDGTYNNRASILFSNGSTNQIRTFLRVGGASQIDVSVNVSDVTDFNKIAFSYKENNFKVYINGALVSTDTSGSVWSADTITKLSFSEINTPAGLFQGKTKNLKIFKRALTDAELQELTT